MKVSQQLILAALLGTISQQQLTNAVSLSRHHHHHKHNLGVRFIQINEGPTGESAAEAALTASENSAAATVEPQAPAAPAAPAAAEAAPAAPAAPAAAEAAPAAPAATGGASEPAQALPQSPTKTKTEEDAAASTDPPKPLPTVEQVKEEAKKKGQEIPIMNDAELKALKDEAKEERAALEKVPEPEMDLDKLAAAGDRVKREAKLKKLVKIEQTEPEKLNEQEATQLATLKKQAVEDKAAVAEEKAIEEAQEKEQQEREAANAAKFAKIKAFEDAKIARDQEEMKKEQPLEPKPKMSDEEIAEKAKLKAANEKIAKMLAEDQARKDAKEAADAKRLADSAALDQGKVAVDAALKTFDAQKALEQRTRELEEQAEQLKSEKKNPFRGQVAQAAAQKQKHEPLEPQNDEDWVSHLRDNIIENDVYDMQINDDVYSRRF